jgi:outer membrane protease
MKKTTVTYLAFLFVFGLAQNAFAERPDVRLSAGIGYLQGETTYQIGGHYTTTHPDDPEGYLNFPVSELDWPLNVVMGSVDLTASYWRLSGEASYKMSLSEPKQKMEDSDWMTQSAPGQLDAYSETGVTLDSKIFDGNINFEFLKYKGWGMQVGLGYMWQDFSFVASNGYQWSPSGYPPDVIYTGPLDGRTITYDVTYSIPYAQLLVNFYTKKFKGALTYQFSPFVNAQDEDKHLLRSKIGKGNCDGYMNAGRFNCTYDFTKHVFAGFDFNYRQIHTTGTQKQHQDPVEENRYVEWWGDIDEDIYSEQIESAVSVGFKF